MCSRFGFVIHHVFLIEEAWIRALSLSDQTEHSAAPGHNLTKPGSAFIRHSKLGPTPPLTRLDIKPTYCFKPCNKAISKQRTRKPSCSTPSHAPPVSQQMGLCQDSCMSCLSAVGKMTSGPKSPEISTHAAPGAVPIGNPGHTTLLGETAQRRRSCRSRVG